VSFGDEEADLASLDAVRVSRVDAHPRPAVCLTAVNSDQYDAEFSVAHPA